VQDTKHVSEFDDEQMIIKQNEYMERVHDDQHLMRHPYWIIMTYFYNPDTASSEQGPNVTFVLYIYSVLILKIQNHLKRQ
jgi:hypothetical protein